MSTVVQPGNLPSVTPVQTSLPAAGLASSNLTDVKAAIMKVFPAGTYPDMPFVNDLANRLVALKGATPAQVQQFITANAQAIVKASELSKDQFGEAPSPSEVINGRIDYLFKNAKGSDAGSGAILEALKGDQIVKKSVEAVPGNVANPSN